MKWLKLAILTVVLALMAAPTLAQDATATPDPMDGVVYLTFDKASVAEGQWAGTVGGDISGKLTSKLLKLDIAGPIWFVQFDWIVDAGAQSFTARMDGTLNTLTGSVTMSGTVIDGAMKGQRTYEQGQLAIPAQGRFLGTILVLPA